MRLKEGVNTVTLELYSSFSDRYYGTKTVTVNVVSKVNEVQEELDDNDEGVISSKAYKKA